MLQQIAKVSKARRVTSAVRKLSEWVALRDTEVAVDYDYSAAETFHDRMGVPWLTPACVELVSVTTPAGGELVRDLDAEEEAYLKQLCLREATE